MMVKMVERERPNGDSLQKAGHILPTATLVALARSPDRDRRIRAAVDPMLPSAELDRLAQDQDSLVRRVAATSQRSRDDYTMVSVAELKELRRLTGITESGAVVALHEAEIRDILRNPTTPVDDIKRFFDLFPDLGTRARNALLFYGREHNGLSSILTLTDSAIRGLNNVGYKTFEEIKEVIGPTIEQYRSSVYGQT